MGLTLHQSYHSFDILIVDGIVHRVALFGGHLLVFRFIFMHALDFFNAGSLLLCSRPRG